MSRERLGKSRRVGDVASFLSSTVLPNHTHLGSYTRTVSLHRVEPLPLATRAARSPRLAYAAASASASALNFNCSAMHSLGRTSGRSVSSWPSHDTQGWTIPPFG